MITAPEHVLNNLHDPEKFVRHPAVAIFDEHEETYWLKNGKPVPPGTPGARRKRRVFRREDLKRIAQKCNARDRIGSLSPIMLGHTDPDQPDETRQPDIVGYAHGYRVVYRRDLRKWVIQTDYYFHKNDYARARKFPRTSIELWPDEEIIDPIAILKRTPQRDLGQWTYSRQGRLVLRYAKDLSMAEDLPLDDAGDLDHNGKVEQFMKHCFSHPHAKYFAKHYGMGEDDVEDIQDDLGLDEPDGDEPETYGADGEDLDIDPTDEPDADAYGMDAPSAGNGSLPGADEDSLKNRRRGRSDQHRRDAMAIRYRKMEREIAEMRRRTAEAEAKSLVTQLIAEEIHLDAPAEIRRLARMSDSQRQAHLSYIRKYYQRTPVGRTGRVATASAPAPAGEPDARHHERAMKYCRSHPGISYDAAIEATKEAK